MTGYAPNPDVDGDGLGSATDPLAIERELEPITWGRFESIATPRGKFVGLARVGALLLAAVATFAVVKWVGRVPSIVREEPSLWWRWVQVGLVVSGVASATLVVGLLCRFAVTRRLTSREVWITSDVIARAGSGAMAAIIAGGTAAWASRAERLFDQESSEVYRWTQLVIAIGGIAAACIASGYFVRIAATGRTWRMWRGVLITFAVLSASWTLLFWIFT